MNTYKKNFDPVCIAEILVDYIYDTDDTTLSDMLSKCDIPRYHGSGMNYIRLSYESKEELDSLWEKDMKSLDNLVEHMREIIKIQHRMLS